jgi:hypothetical protein
MTMIGVLNASNTASDVLPIRNPNTPGPCNSSCYHQIIRIGVPVYAPGRVAPQHRVYGSIRRDSLQRFKAILNELRILLALSPSPKGGFSQRSVDSIATTWSPAPRGAGDCAVIKK